jgi:hypothetical protein
MEGALVRHPPPSLTRRRGERGPGGAAAWSWSLDVATRGGSGQRHRVATEGARGHVTSSVRGRKSRGREAQRGGATDRSSTRTARRPFPTRAPELRLRTHGGTGRGRGPKLEGRRQATLHPGRVRWRSNDRRRAGAGRRGRPKGRKLPRACPEGAKALEGGPARDCRGVPQGSPRARARKGSGKGSRCARESDGPCWVHVVVSRLQKSERSIFLRARSACREALTRFEAGRASTGIV